MGNLSHEEQVLTQLVERGEQLALRKAEAVAILINRGLTDSADELLSTRNSC